MMTPQQGYDLLTAIIAGDRRPMLYKEAVDIAEQAQQFTARDSERQRPMLRKFRAKENKDQEDQRVRLTNAITSVALAAPYSYAAEVWRTDGVKKSVTAPDTLRAKVDDHFRRYWHDDSLHRYCFDSALHYSRVDPNAWTVFEAIIGPNEAGATVIQDLYPVEVLSREVRGYSYDRTGQLEHLAFEFTREARRRGEEGMRTMSDFYLYGAGFSIHFAEYDPDYEGEDYAGMGYALTVVNARQFFARIAMNATREVPAVRWSAYLSGDHGRKIGETLHADANPILEQLLKDNSLLQLQKYLHIYAEKHQYVRRCNHRDETGRECQYGYYGGTRYEQDRCRACKGTGKVMAAGEQDVITLAWPERAEDLVDLARLTHYVERPIAIVEFYRAEVEAAQRAVLLAIFNQQQVDLSQVVQPETATKTRLDYDKIYNKLSPFAELVSRAWEKAQRTAYQYYGQQAEADMTYPHDFKLQGLDELIAEYNAAREAGVPYEVLSGIADDMLAKKYRNMPDRAAEVRAFERWKPWKDKGVEEIALILTLRAETDPARVLWENWDQVVELVRLDLSPRLFSDLPEDQQRAALYEAAAAFVTGVQYRTAPDPFAQPAGVMADEDNDENEPNAQT